MPGVLGKSLIRYFKEEPGSKVSSLRDLCSSTFGVVLESHLPEKRRSGGFNYGKSILILQVPELDRRGAKKPTLGDK